MENTDNILIANLSNKDKEILNMMYKSAQINILALRSDYTVDDLYDLYGKLGLLCLIDKN